MGLIAISVLSANTVALGLLFAFVVRMSKRSKNQFLLLPLVDSVKTNLCDYGHFVGISVEVDGNREGFVMPLNTARKMRDALSLSLKV